MQNMAVDEEPDKITSLIQVGFGFQAVNPCALGFQRLLLILRLLTLTRFTCSSITQLVCKGILWP